MGNCFKGKLIFVLLLILFLALFGAGSTLACGGGGGGGGGGESDSTTSQGTKTDELQEFLDFIATDDDSGDSNDNGIVDVLEIDEAPVVYESGEPVDGNPAGDLVGEENTQSVDPAPTDTDVDITMISDEDTGLVPIGIFAGSIGLAYITGGLSMPISAAIGGGYSYITSSNIGAERRGDAILGFTSGFFGGPIGQSMFNEVLNQIREHGTTHAPNQNVRNPSHLGTQQNPHGLPTQP